MKRDRTLIRCTRTRKTPAFPNRHITRRHPPRSRLPHHTNNLSPRLPPLPPSAPSPPPASTAARPSPRRPSRCHIAVPRSIISNNTNTSITAAPPSPTRRQTSTAGPRPRRPWRRRTQPLSRTTMATSKKLATGHVVVVVMARTTQQPLGSSKLHNGGQPCAKGPTRRA
ncbi:hypothetical protein HDK77DRAFT_444987 [Phyllosticta capitalensis]